MDIRPHRRLAVPFEPPLFSDIVDVSDFVSHMYEHFGVVRLNSEMFGYASVSVIRRMCDSLGLRLLIDCPSRPDVAVRASSDGADYVTADVSSVHSVVSGCSGRAKVLVRVFGPFDVEMTKVSSAAGVFCDSVLAAVSRSSLGTDAVVFASGGDVVSAIRDGANFATVDAATVKARPADHAFRQLAEDFREHT